MRKSQWCIPQNFRLCHQGELLHKWIHVSDVSRQNVPLYVWLPIFIHGINICVLMSHIYNPTPDTKDDLLWWAYNLKKRKTYNNGKGQPTVDSMEVLQLQSRIPYLIGCTIWNNISVRDWQYILCSWMLLWWSHLALSPGFLALF